jgi:hypothetical protein
MIKNVTTTIVIGIVVVKILVSLFGNFENNPANVSGNINPIKIGAKQ